MDPDEIIVPNKVKELLESRLKTLSKKETHVNNALETLIDHELKDKWPTK